MNIPFLQHRPIHLGIHIPDTLACVPLFCICYGALGGSAGTECRIHAEKVLLVGENNGTVYFLVDVPSALCF